MATHDRHPSLQQVVSSIYDAALEPGVWPEVMADIAAYGRSSFGLIYWREKGQCGDPLALRVETDHHELMDEYFRGAVGGDSVVRIFDGPVDVPSCNDSWQPRDDFLKSEGYRHYFSPAGIEDRASVLLFRKADHHAILSLGRGRKEDPFNPQSLVALQELSPHLRRALQIVHRFRRDTAHQNLLQAVLEKVEDGVFFLDAAGRVIFTNSTAESLLTQQVLTIHNRRLRAASIAESSALDGLLERAIKTGDGRATDPGGSFLLHRTDGTLFASVTVSPLRKFYTSEHWGSKQIRAAVFVRESRAPAEPDPQMLRSYFGLSPAEVRLAQGLGRGQRLKEVAHGLGVSRETARSQLSSIFDKTGVRRQSDLIKMLFTVHDQAAHGGRVFRN